MKKTTNTDIMNLFNNTELSTGLLEVLEKLALSILKEPVDIKNQMTMQGILVEVNKTLNEHIYVEKIAIEWEDKFQTILDKWYEKNQNFAKEEIVLNNSDLLHEDLKK